MSFCLNFFVFSITVHLMKLVAILLDVSYEYFLNKFAKNIASDDGVFFTPKSLVKIIVNIIEPKSGILLDPACGSGGMFVQSGDFINQSGMSANSAMTFYGQEKVEYNAQLCLMNMAVHGLTGVIKSGDEANSFYHDAHNLDGCCDYVMANPPFNVDKVKAESCESAKRLPFGMPSVNKNKEVGNANYLWISYFLQLFERKKVVPVLLWLRLQRTVKVKIGILEKALLELVL